MRRNAHDGDARRQDVLDYDGAGPEQVMRGLLASGPVDEEK